MNPAFWILWAIGTVLQLVLLQSVVTRRLYRKAPILALYLLVLFLTCAADAMLYVDLGGWGRNVPAIRVYWVNDTVRQIALLLALLSFMYQIRRREENARFPVRLVLLAGCVLIAAGILTYHGPINEGWTQVIRDMSFVAALCNLVLWVRLLKAAPDRFLLALSAGAGVQLGGEAIGQSFRSMALANKWTFLLTSANYLLVVAHLLCLLIWVCATWKLTNIEETPAGGQPAAAPGF